MLFEGGTPLNNPPIEIHANSSMFALIFWPHVTIFCIFWLHEWLKWILKFNSKSLFWCQSRQIFEVRAIEQRHHEFQPIHMPPHQFWPRYHSDGLSPVHVRFEFFSKQICNVEALICHFYKNIKTLTQIHFPRDAHIFRTCTIFYRHLALARRSKFSDMARNPAKQRSISSAVLRSLMSVGNATDKAEWRRTYGQIPLLRSHSDSTSALRAEVSPRTISSLTLAFGLDFGATRRSLAEDKCISDEKFRLVNLATASLDLYIQS